MGNIVKAQEVTLPPDVVLVVRFKSSISHSSLRWQDVTEVFFKLFKGAAVPLMQLEANSTRRKFIWNFPKKKPPHSHFLLNQLQICVTNPPSAKWELIMMPSVKRKQYLYRTNGLWIFWIEMSENMAICRTHVYNTQWWVVCSPSLTVGTLTG